MDRRRRGMVGALGWVCSPMVWQHSPTHSCGLAGRGDSGNRIGLRPVERFPSATLPAPAFGRSRCAMHGRLPAAICLRPGDKLSPQPARQPRNNCGRNGRFHFQLRFSRPRSAKHPRHLSRPVPREAKAERTRVRSSFEPGAVRVVAFSPGARFRRQGQGARRRSSARSGNDRAFVPRIVRPPRTEGRLPGARQLARPPADRLLFLGCASGRQMAERATSIPEFQFHA